MSRQPIDRLEMLPPGLAARLDPLCDRFELAWMAGERPRIEDFLGQAAEADRPALLHELLALELDYRVRNNEPSTAGDFCQRLPQYADLVGEAVAAHSSSGRLAPKSTNPPGSNSNDTKIPRSQLAPAPLTAAGRFLIQGEIAHGGMGAVFRAHDPVLNRLLAIKVLREDYRSLPAMSQRFGEEARLTGQLQHPGIPPVFEIGVLKDGRPFFAMKLIEGRTLSELFKGRSSPSEDLPRFLGIFKLICQTMAYAHSRGVMHRDLKPQNIMVGAFGEVQVMDWGLAKVRGSASPEA